MALNIRVEPAPPRTASESETKRPKRTNTLVTLYDDETSMEIQVFTTRAELELNTHSRVSLIQARSRGIKVESNGFGDVYLTALHSRFRPDTPEDTVNPGVNG